MREIYGDMQGLGVNVLNEMWRIRRRAFEVYEYEDADEIKSREFLQHFLNDLKSREELREFVYGDTHILDVLYRIAIRAGMREDAKEFREACYQRILDEVKESGELRYPLQLTFILENYGHEATERVKEVLNYLKPKDRNVEMIKLVLNNVRDGYDERAVEELKGAYRKLKLEKSFGRLARVFERILSTE